ncbi:MAG TPA: hypothetical protein VNS32_09300 [Flavisolibacter sp.]|nr:hypothetical protein [Flavisolibacter sp.]
MSWLFQSDTAFKAIRYVNNDIIKWQPGKAVYPDSTISINYLNGQNIFSKNTGLTQYLNKQDAAYFSKQIRGQHRQKWQLKLKGIELYDTAKLINNRLERAIFSYSIPLFSSDNKYVVIIQAFYCGLLCGGGSYNLYERQENNTWRKIKTFNEWAE